MASENKMKEKFSQITSRQKAIMGAMVVVVLIIVWQVTGLFGGGKSTPTPVAIKPVSTMQATSSSPSAANNRSATSPSQGPEAASSLPAEHVVAPRQATVLNEPQFMKLQKMTEEKYIGKLNELEELKIQRQIAETNQAIAAAKLATVSAEKDISDLLTKPAPVLVPPSAYANQLVAPTVTGQEVVNVNNGTTMPPPPIKEEPVIDYSLISVSMQLNRWSAVLGYQGKLYSVNVGDTLQPDGSVVTSINKNSVILKKDDKTRKVNIVSSI